MLNPYEKYHRVSKFIDLLTRFTRVACFVPKNFFKTYQALSFLYTAVIAEIQYAKVALHEIYWKSQKKGVNTPVGMSTHLKYLTLQNFN